VVCACAVAASPALAKEFEASRLPKECSEELPCKTHGVGIGEVSTIDSRAVARFKFGGFEILCRKVVTKAKEISEGAISWETNETLSMEVKFGECGVPLKAGSGGFVRQATSFNGGLPVKFVYHQNGFSELGSGETTSEVEVGGETTTFKVGNGACTIGWPAQTVPAIAEKKPESEYSSAVYSNTEVAVPETQLKKFPSGFQKRLLIANAFKGMKYEYIEGQCKGEGGFETEFKGAEAKTGLLEGTFEEQVIGGNLSISP
jgi:hypothetical protein